MIDFMELIKETTKFRRDAQYLHNPDDITAVNSGTKLSQVQRGIRLGVYE